MDESNYKRLAIGAPLFSNLTKLCSVAECGKEKCARGFCKKHWTRWKKHGDPLLGERPAPIASHCGVYGCEKAGRSRFQGEPMTLCVMHYLRKMNNGSLDATYAEPMPDGLCSVDGCAVEVRSSRAKYCERHYYQVRRTGSILLVAVEFMESLKPDKVVKPAVVAVVPKALKPIKIKYERCQYCDQPTNGYKWCRRRCATRSLRGNPLLKTCVICSVEFSPASDHGPDSHVCSPECLKQRVIALRKEWAAKNKDKPIYKARARAAEYKRKALKISAFIEDVDRNAVMARDKWVCHLCGEKIPAKEVWPKPLFGTLDHVVPLARGGTHGYGNIKAAHLRCNISKGAKTIGQLGFVFNDPIGRQAV